MTSSESNPEILPTLRDISLSMTGLTLDLDTFCWVDDDTVLDAPSSPDLGSFPLHFFPSPPSRPTSLNSTPLASKTKESSVSFVDAYKTYMDSVEMKNMYCPRYYYGQCQSSSSSSFCKTSSSWKSCGESEPESEAESPSVANSETGFSTMPSTPASSVYFSDCDEEKWLQGQGYNGEERVKTMQLPSTMSVPSKSSSSWLDVNPPTPYVEEDEEDEENEGEVGQADPFASPIDPTFQFKTPSQYVEHDLDHGDDLIINQTNYYIVGDFKNSTERVAVAVADQDHTVTSVDSCVNESGRSTPFLTFRWPQSSTLSSPIELA